jgi:hypothetical protein
VYVPYGTFTMSGGNISGNTATRNGGGVYVTSANGTFEMKGGIISGNTATGTNTAFTPTGAGGGVYAYSGTFQMSGGTISGNTATGNTTNKGYGGGVYVNTASFTKTNGVIYGFTSGDALGNLVGTRNLDKTPDTHEANKGDAVYYDSGSKYRDSTLEAGDNISTANTGVNWEN